MPQPEWVDIGDVEQREHDARITLAKALANELRALDGLAELAVPGNIQIPSENHDASVNALLGLESSLFSDIRAFRHLVADGFIPEALHLARAIYVGLWKGELCISDSDFATRVASDERIPDSEVMQRFAHLRATTERPNDWDHEAEQLASIASDYERMSRLAHKRKGGSEFQGRADDGGGVTIFRDPPSMLLDGYGASIVGKLAAEAARTLYLLVPFLLSRAGIDRVGWDDRFAGFSAELTVMVDAKEWLQTE